MVLDRNVQKNNSNRGVIIVVTIVILISLFGARNKIASFFSLAPSHDSLREEVKNIIKEESSFILNVLEETQYRQIKEAQEKAFAKLNEKAHEKRSEIENSELSPTVGPSDAPIVIVYYFDYNCGHCRKGNKLLHDIMSKNHDIKLVYKELPILGEKSIEDAKYALAVYTIDSTKYVDFHDALISSKEELNIDDLLTTLSISREDFDKALQSTVIDDMLQSNRNLASEIGISGTPAFIINGNVIAGLDERVIMQKIEDIRKESTKE